MSALEVRDLAVEYHRRGQPSVQAVAGVDLDVERGQIVGLVGESGCGKSTVARAIVGMVAPSAGSITFEGRPVLPLAKRARRSDLVRLQMVFQNPYASLNPRRKIGRQIADPLVALGLVAPENRASRTAELLDEVGLPASAAGRYPHRFSGGQRQRIAIARALAAEPSVVVLDEPLSSLDASVQAQLANLLVKLKDDLRVGMLLISHDLAIVRHVADFVSVMYLGQIVESGLADRLWSAPRHPYTASLLNAIPQADGRGVLPEHLRGDVPNPAHPPDGCRFHTRCPFAFDRCRIDRPVLQATGETGNTVACWLRGGRGLDPHGVTPVSPASRKELP